MAHDGEFFILRLSQLECRSHRFCHLIVWPHCANWTNWNYREVVQATSEVNLDFQMTFFKWYCIAIVDQFYFSFSVKVVRWESSSSLKPIKKTVGDSVTFDCRLSDPSARVKLMQKVSSRVLIERSTDGCRVGRAGQKFVIHAVNFNDFGIYYCEAPQAKIRRKEEAYLTINPGKVRNEFCV